jgi:septum formation protein
MVEELIVASTSPYRRKMLVDAGIRVRCEAPGIDERAVEREIGCDTPEQLASALARRKARAVADRFPGRWVLGADQVVFDPERPHVVIGKPSDPDDHLRRLRALVGREQILVTAFLLTGGEPGASEVGEIADAVCTRLCFRGDITEDELRAYVATGEGAGCAGGYAVEGKGAFLVARIDGDLFNVIGLPLLRVLTALRAVGWRFA